MSCYAIRQKMQPPPLTVKILVVWMNPGCFSPTLLGLVPAFCTLLKITSFHHCLLSSSHCNRLLWRLLWVKFLLVVCGLLWVFPTCKLSFQVCRHWMINQHVWTCPGMHLRKMACDSELHGCGSPLLSLIGGPYLYYLHILPSALLLWLIHEN